MISAINWSPGIIVVSQLHDRAHVDRRNGVVSVLTSIE